MTAKTRNYALRAILIADMVNYSAAVSRDEAATLDFVERCFGLFRESCPAFDGAIIKTMGDGILAEFASVSQAVRYALHMHDLVRTALREPMKPAAFRIAVHVGEVEKTDSDVFGHTVNVASRLVTLAKPGGLCISQAVFEHIRHLGLAFEAAGLTQLRNIPNPIPVYHFTGAEPEAASPADAIMVTTIDGVTMRNAAGAEAVLRSVRARALIGYLALHPGGRDYKNRLLALLWPGDDVRSARRALADCVRRVERESLRIGSSVLTHGHDQVGLSRRGLEIDLHAMVKKLSTGAIDDILLERPDWSEAILRGTEPVGALFDTWLGVSRHTWRDRVTQAIEACLDRFEIADPLIRRAATALLMLEPSHEVAIQKLLRHYAQANNIGLAVKTFAAFSDLLRQRYNAAPSVQTRSLFEAISGGNAPPDGQKPALAQADRRPVIQIVQLAPDAHYLAVGFRTALIVNLSRFREWIVLESPAVADQGAEQNDYSLVLSQMPGVAEGGLSLLLKDNRTSHVIWSDVVKISLDTWSDTQQLLVRQIAAHLHIYVSADRLSRVASGDYSNLPDYDRWLQGEHLLSMWTPAAEDQAAVLFADVITSSPRFSPAYASLASILNVRHLIRPGKELDAREERRALALARTAVELDGLDSRNQLTVAWSAAMAGEYDIASVHFDLAVNLNSSNPAQLISAAQGYSFLGYAARARQLLGDALQLAPFLLAYQWCYIASTRWMIGDYDGAVVAANRGLASTIDTHGWRAAALAELGRHDEAKAAFDLQLQAVSPVWRGRAGLTATVLIDWFLGCFPIAERRQQDRLRAALKACSRTEDAPPR